jgi:hypothetical protein
MILFILYFDIVLSGEVQWNEIFEFVLRSGVKKSGANSGVCTAQAEGLHAKGEKDGLLDRGPLLQHTRVSPE